MGSDEFTSFSAFVPPVEVNGNDIGEIKSDDADGGDDVMGGGVEAE